MSKAYLVYYSVIDEANLVATCKLCPQHEQKRFVKFTKSSKTNLKTHILVNHKDAKQEIQEKLESVNPFQLAALSTEKQEEITEAVVDFMIESDQPISLPITPPFRKFMKRVSPKWKPVGKHKTRAKIIQKGKPFPFNPNAYRQKYGKPSTTVDIWSSKQRLGYMAVSLHYQTPNEFITKCMACNFIPSPHNAENIRKAYTKILSEYGMNVDDVFKAVGDSAANMKKAFGVSIFDAIADEDDVLDPFDHNESGVTFGGVEDDEYGNVDVDFREIFQDQYRRGCNIHQLQLLVKDMLKNLPQRYKNVIAKCKIACRKLHQSVKLTEAMEKGLPAESETRWNGQWRLMMAVMDDFAECKEKLDAGFVDSDLQVLKSLTNFLKPFHQMTKVLEAEKVATIHQVIPFVLVLEKHIRNCPDIPQDFQRVCMGLLESRFAFVTTDPHLLSATVLSSHGTKFLSVALNESLLFPSRTEVLGIVSTYIAGLVAELPTPSDQMPIPCEVPSNICKSSDAMFGYDLVNELDSQNWKAVFEAHLHRTPSMSTDLDPLMYWKRQPEGPMSVVAIQILGVPASSAPVERIFSHAGNICTARRTSMKPDLLSALVRARFNGIEN